MTKIVEDIKSVHKIAERNHRLEAKRNKVNERSTCQLAPPTPYKGKKFNSVKWQQRLNMVQDPLEAVRLLVKKLGLAPLDEWRIILSFTHLIFNSLFYIPFSLYFICIYGDSSVLSQYKLRAFTSYPHIMCGDVWDGPSTAGTFATFLQALVFNSCLIFAILNNLSTWGTFLNFCTSSPKPQQILAFKNVVACKIFIAME